MNCQGRDNQLNGELTNLFIGAIIALLASAVTYCLNHFLKLREQRLIREFEVREKARGFYHQVYGVVAMLTDFVTSFLKEDSHKVWVLTEKGYSLLPKRQVIERYKQAYEECARFWFESRKKGLEVFFTKESAGDLEKFWGYAGYFYENNDWETHKEFITTFKEISQKICDDMDKLLGLREKKSRIPKWLNPRHW